MFTVLLQTVIKTRSSIPPKNVKYGLREQFLCDDFYVANVCDHVYGTAHNFICQQFKV